MSNVPVDRGISFDLKLNFRRSPISCRDGSVDHVLSIARQG